MRHYCRSIPLVVFIAASLLGALLKIMVLQASPLMANPDAPIQTVSLALVAQSSPPQDAPTIGYPCGRKENLRFNAMCLYGVVRQGGQPVAGAEVTVAIDDKSKQETTKIRKNESIPTYAINLGRLNPHYLQTVVVTATLGNVTVHRKLVLFWDWETHNQRFDIDLDIVQPTGTGLVFGQVIHYASGGPVTGAHITATSGSTIVSATTADSNEPKPGYKLDLSQIPVNQSVSVTAFYSGYVASTMISRTDAAQELNLVTGRPCDSIDDIPRQGTSRSLPDDSKTLPDEGCFWGKVLFNGTPRAGAEVRLTLSNTTYLGTSRLVSGEKEPLYAIIVPNIAHDANYQGLRMTVTAVYSGAMSTQVVTMNLDAGGNQHIDDIRLADIGVLSNFPFQDTDSIRFMTLANGEVWWSSLEGIIRYDLARQVYTQYTSLNGLASLSIYDIAKAPDHSVWIRTDKGLNHYVPDLNRWETFTNPVQSDLLFSFHPIIVDEDGYLWLDHGESGLGYYTYTASTGLSEVRTFPAISQTANSQIEDIAVIGDYLWVSIYGKGVSQYKIQRNPPDLILTRQFTTANGLFSDSGSKIAIQDKSSVWFGDIKYESSVHDYVVGASHYISGTTNLKTYTATLNLNDSNGGAFAVGKDNSIWVGTLSGAKRYMYQDNTGLILQETFTSAHGLGDNVVSDILVDQDGSLWFGTSAGVSHYTPSDPNQKWRTLVTRQLAAPDIKVMKEASDQTLWLGTANGLTHYFPGKTHKEDRGVSFTVGNSGLADNLVHDILLDQNGWLWIATANGLSHYYPGTNQAGDIWETYTQTHGLPSDHVLALARQGRDLLWVGTTEGVALFEYVAGNPQSNTPSMFRHRRTFTTKDGLANNSVGAIAISADNQLWFGTNSGVSHYYDGVWETLNTTTTNSMLVSNTITAIAVDQDQYLWFGTTAGVSQYKPIVPPSTESWQTFLQGRILSTIVTDLYGSVWFGSYRQGEPNTCESHYYESWVDRYTRGGNSEWQNIDYDSADCENEFTPLGVFTLGGADTVWINNYYSIDQRRQPPQQSDLSVQLVQPDIILQAAPISYLITVTNNGQRDAFNNILKVSLTNGEFSSVEPPMEVDQSDKTQPVFLLPTIPATGTRQLALKVTATLASGVAPGERVSARATISTTTPEAFLSNNSATVEDRVRDPFKADLHITINAPPLLHPGRTESYTVTLGNGGGLTATDILLNIILPKGLRASDPTQLQQTIDALPPTLRNQAGKSFPIQVQVDPSVAEDSVLAVNATANYVFTKEGQHRDALAQAEAYTSLKQARTLFFVAPDRMKGIYVTELMNKLHTLAKREDVKGVVIDVLRDEAVREAYMAWAANPLSDTVANRVAQAIKTDLIDANAKELPNLRYLVFVGDDEVIPFYRVPDQSNSEWPEHSYASESLPNDTSVRPALLDDTLLTDDFYVAHLTGDTKVGDQPQALFVPDFASGRLVEAPEQIIVALDTFIRNNGILNLAQHPTALVATDKELTADLGEQVCSAVGNEGFQSMCMTSTRTASDALSSPLPGLVINAQHSNHASLGEWPVENSSGLPANAAEERLLLLFGCHAGLSVATPKEIDKRLTDLDLAETWLSKGGVVIGSTAYAYASRHELAYSEIFAEQFLNHLLTTTVQLLGPVLIQTKQEYFATRQASKNFDPLDTKVLLPMTLYGLPMWQVQMPQAASLAQPTGASVAASTMITEITRPSDAQLVPTNVSGEGNYYVFRYQGHDHVLVRKGYPMQPSYSFNLPPSNDGRLAHGVVLRSATYHDEQPFDSVIGDIWVLDDGGPTSFIEPAPEFTGWDHEHFYSFGVFKSLANALDSRSQANLNLVLGNYNRETQTERIFDNFKFEVLYSSATITDFTAPVVITPTGANITGTGIDNQVIISVQATDADSKIVAAVGVCDNGSSYDTVPMVNNGNSWSGVCKPAIKRFSVQVIDAAGNVGKSVWVDKLPLSTLVPAAYLPTAIKDYIPPLPDLIVSKIVATQQNITVVIRNIGQATVFDDFWVEACLDPHPIPTKVNQICKGLSFQYAMWGYLASQSPIAPGQTVTLTVGDAYYTPTHSIFTPTFAIGTPVYAHVDAAHKYTTYGGVFETHERDGLRYNNILSSTVVAGAVEQKLSGTQTNQPLERTLSSGDLPPLPDMPFDQASEESLKGGLPQTSAVTLTPIVTQTLPISGTKPISTEGQLQSIWLPFVVK